MIFSHFHSGISGILILGGILSTTVCAPAEWEFEESLVVDVPIESYPYSAAVLIENQIWGAGAILNKKWILTAAFNCFWVDPSFITVRVGSGNWTKGGFVFSVEECITHSSYNGFWDYNIALIKVNGQMKLGPPSVKKAFLPTRKAAGRSGTKATVSGWGATGSNDNTGQFELQAVSQLVLDEATCNKTYVLTESSFCAQNKTASPCMYDYGAPLITFLKNKKPVLVGLFQGSTNCSDPAVYPAVYTDVFYFNDWIKKTMKTS